MTVAGIFSPLVAMFMLTDLVDESLTIRLEGANALCFTAVSGTSKLPIEYMRTGMRRDWCEEVSLPKFWLADRMVTAGEFAALMERPLPEGADPEAPMANLEWADAFAYCERFAARYADQLPPGTVATLPDMLEWAHAVRLAGRKLALDGPVGTFLFTGNRFSGFMHTMPVAEESRQKPDVAVELEVIPKRVKHPRVGLRLALVGVAGERLGGNAMVSRGMVLLQHGFLTESTRYFDLALAKGKLDDRERLRAARARETAAAGWTCEQEDWSGLVACAAEFAARRGYRTEPFASRWQWAGVETMYATNCAAAYAEAGVSGAIVRIGELPPALQADQPLGEATAITVPIRGGGEKSATLEVTTNLCVELLRCDFTGDGLEDLVTERFGDATEDGYRYDFYERLMETGHVRRLSLRTAGLCVLPRADGKKGCGFLTVSPAGEPLLSVQLLEFDAGAPVWTNVTERPFFMLDAEEDRLYRAAPFIGGGKKRGWERLEGLGCWYRPLFWPWEQGIVQGRYEVERMVAEEERVREALWARLRELWAKWPRAGERLSAWELPEHAARFAEIDRFQRTAWRTDKVREAAAFETLCREAITLRLDPALWHYNHACALAVQKRSGEALAALERAVAAGFSRVESAREDGDLAALRADPAFDDLLEVMGAWRGWDWQSPKARLRVRGSGALLTADCVYYPFRERAYGAELATRPDGRLFYLDRDGESDPGAEGFVVVSYDAEAVRFGRNLGPANVSICQAGIYLPVVARGRFRPEAVETAAFDARALARRNVLGLYSTREETEAQDWCLLYRGGCEEGQVLAQAVRQAYESMSRRRIDAMVRAGEFATTFVRWVHQAMREGMDGAVIDVKNLDCDVLRRLAAGTSENAVATEARELGESAAEATDDTETGGFDDDDAGDGEMEGVAK